MAVIETGTINFPVAISQLLFKANSNYISFSIRYPNKGTNIAVPVKN